LTPLSFGTSSPKRAGRGPGKPSKTYALS
jgi:hypothetical protein